jgi:hypothetical protein
LKGIYICFEISKEENKPNIPLMGCTFTFLVFSIEILQNH